MLMAALVFVSCHPQDQKLGDEDQALDRVVVGYVTSWSDRMPDPNLVTHLNYAFGHVTTGFDSVRVDNPERLCSIVALKEANPHLKVLLSVGGWGSSNFSEMASDEAHRISFARSCQKAIDTYSLDGIDIDWEYPTSSAAGISSSPDDTKNFTLLMHDLRQAIGTDHL
ncbi:MAG: glycosyl hydrolase family 18, partial [Bacteroidales bacterium]|nr:glycosyl hydrolase family 18 [Bacteroidales bacterium]